MGKPSDSTKEESLRTKVGSETRKSSGVHSVMLPTKVLHKVSNSRTQLFLLFIAIFYGTNYLSLFEHPTNELVTNVRT